MYRKVTAFLAAAMILSAVALTGCSQSTEEVSSTESAVSSAVESTAASEDNVSSDDASEVVSSENASSDDDASEDESRALETSTKKFNKVFAKNPLDKAFEQQMDEATTNREMISVASTFSGLWEAEITHAYDLLTQKGAAGISDDENNWESTKDDQLQAIYDSMDSDGSAALVNRAIAAKDFYRSKAKELYRQLYQYDPNFTYLYSPY